MRAKIQGYVDLINAGLLVVSGLTLLYTLFFNTSKFLWVLLALVSASVACGKAVKRYTGGIYEDFLSKPFTAEEIEACAKGCTLRFAADRYCTDYRLRAPDVAPASPQQTEGMLVEKDMSAADFPYFAAAKMALVRNPWVAWAIEETNGIHMVVFETGKTIEDAISKMNPERVIEAAGDMRAVSILRVHSRLPVLAASRHGSLFYETKKLAEKASALGVNWLDYTGYQDGSVADDFLHLAETFRTGDLEEPVLLMYNETNAELQEILYGASRIYKPLATYWPELTYTSVALQMQVAGIPGYGER